PPRRVSCHRAHSRGEFVVVERRAVRIEPREFVELQRRTRHDKTAARVEIALDRCRSSKKGDAFVIFEHCRVGEGERVGFKTKVSGDCVGASKSRYYAEPAQAHEMLCAAAEHNHGRAEPEVDLPSAKLPRRRNFLYRFLSNSSIGVARSRSRFC